MEDGKGERTDVETTKRLDSNSLCTVRGIFENAALPKDAFWLG